MRMDPVEAFPLPLLLLAAVSCGEASAPDAWAVRDSAGVRIVEVSWDDLPVLDTLGGPARYEVGGADDELELFDVRDARFVDGGRIAVAHASAGEVLLRDTASGETRRLGRAGAGPDELGTAASVHDEGEGRVGVFDVARSRYLIFGADGAVVESWSPTDRGVDPPHYHLRSGDGTVYVGRSTGSPGEGGVTRADLPVLALREDRVDTVAWIAGQEVFATGTAAGLSAFGPATELAAAAEGLWIGDTATPEVVRIDRAGTPRLAVRWTGGPPRRLDEERVDRMLAPLLEALPEEQRERARTSVPETLPMPDSVPAFQHLVVGEEGTLWVGSWLGPEMPQLPLPRGPREWLLVATGGTPVGRVVTPSGFVLQDAGEGWALGVQTDDLGVETVRMYDLDRRGPGVSSARPRTRASPAGARRPG